MNAIHDWAMDFQEGIAVVRLGKEGVIDNKGNFILQPVWKDIRVEDDIIIAMDDSEKKSDIQLNGELIGKISVRSFSLSYLNENMFNYYENGNQGLIDVKGNVLTSPVFKTIGRFNDGLAPASVEKKESDDGYYYPTGFINKKGEFVITPIFHDAKEFSDGLAAVAANRRSGWRLFLW